MRTYDTIVIGAGIIGLSLAIELNKRGLKVLVVEKGEPGRESSWAAGGMLVEFPFETAPALRELAAASAGMYPEFVHELQHESGVKIDLRSQGTLLFLDEPLEPQILGDRGWVARWRELEPALKASNVRAKYQVGIYVKERSVDPRHLTEAAIVAARHRGVDLSSGNEVLGIETSNGKVSGVRTSKTQFAAAMVVNCAGAWAGQIEGYELSTRPVKGQMLCVIMPEKELIRHVVRTPEVYLIPRSDGRLLIGATAEESGFDKRTVPETIQKLRQAALDLVPKLANARFLEAWAGLRPATPDRLPILGPTPTSGSFVATGHFRDGILLAPITARLMAQTMTGQQPDIAISNFSPERFAVDAPGARVM